MLLNVGPGTPKGLCGLHPGFSESKRLEESIAAGTHTRSSLSVICFVVLIPMVSPGKTTVMHTLRDTLEREGGGSTTTLVTREPPQIRTTKKSLWWCFPLQALVSHSSFSLEEGEWLDSF